MPRVSASRVVGTAFGVCTRSSRARAARPGEIAARSALSNISTPVKDAPRKGRRNHRPVGIKARRGLPKVLSVEEVDRLLRLAEEEAEEGAPGSAAQRRAQRLYVLLELLYATGMRVSELVGLPRAAVIRDASFLMITGKGDKERVVPLNDRSRDAVMAWLKGVPTGRYLFPATGDSGHLERQVFARDLKALAGRAGISTAKVSPHVLRHAFASHLLQGGANLRIVQTLLGHADISTTQIYTHLLDERLRELVEKNHPLADD